MTLFETFPWNHVPPDNIKKGNKIMGQGWNILWPNFWCLFPKTERVTIMNCLLFICSKKMVIGHKQKRTEHAKKWTIRVNTSWKHLTVHWVWCNTGTPLPPLGPSPSLREAVARLHNWCYCRLPNQYATLVFIGIEKIKQVFSFSCQENVSVMDLPDNSDRKATEIKMAFTEDGSACYVNHHREITKL